MRHRYECQLRWADLDMLGHVNNVTYVDYLQEARVDMLLTHAPDSRAEDLAEGVVVVRHEVAYLVPLTFRHRPVLIDSWVSEIRAASFTMAYEVYDETPEGRVVYLRATSVLTPFVFAEERPRRITAAEKETLTRFLAESPLPGSARVGTPRTNDDGRFGLQVRFSDVDVYGHVNNVKYFEFFQEARVDYMRKIWKRMPEASPSVPVVVAEVDVDYRMPILFRPEPYAVDTWVSSVGRSSFVMESEVRDGDTVFARARVVLVPFDKENQKAVPTPEAYRALLLAEMER